MIDYGNDLYTEPDGDPDTLANLGPLRGMAGIWEGADGVDEHPVPSGTDRNTLTRVAEPTPNPLASPIP